MTPFTLIDSIRIVATSVSPARIGRAWMNSCDPCTTWAKSSASSGSSSTWTNASYSTVVAKVGGVPPCWSKTAWNAARRSALTSERTGG